MAHISKRSKLDSARGGMDKTMAKEIRKGTVLPAQWHTFVNGKTVRLAYEDGDWQVIQFTDGSRLEFVLGSHFHLVEANRQ